MVFGAVVPLVSSDDSGSTAGSYYTYKITPEGNVYSDGVLMSGAGNHNSKFTGYYASSGNALEGVDSDKKYVGDWGFDENGYGPFNSFYAAFDPNQNNKMVCHLNPDNLAVVAGSTDVTEVEVDGVKVAIKDCNIMWCLPTVYWSVDSEGDLMLTNDPNAGGTAYAHTVVEDGEPKTYEFMAIGVYEASKTTVGDKDILVSKTDKQPLHSTTRADMRTYANNQKVSTIEGSTDAVNGKSMLWNYYMWQLYRFSVITVGGGWDSQGIFGKGEFSDIIAGGAGDRAAKSGDLDSWGPYAGKIGGYTNLDSVKVFIEDAWGSLNDAVDGVLIYKEGNEIGLYATQESIPEDKAGSEYQKIGNLPVGYWMNGNRTENFCLPCTDCENAAFWGMPDLDTAGQGSTKTGLYDSYSGFNEGTKQSPRMMSVGGLSYGHSATWSDQFGVSYISVTQQPNKESDGTCGRLAFLFEDDRAAEVLYDHSMLKEALAASGDSGSDMSGLSDKISMDGNSTYEKLQDVGEFIHTGWLINGVEYPAEHPFVLKYTHTAVSVWKRLPAVTYDHDQLIEASGDPDSVAGLPTGMEMTGRTNYEKLEDRNGFKHVGWRVGSISVGPTDPFIIDDTHTAESLWAEIPVAVLDHSNLISVVGEDAEGLSELESKIAIEGSPGYPQLPDTAGYRHVGWEVNGQRVGSDSGFVEQTTHTAKSVWTKIAGFLPIIIVDDDEEAIEVTIEEASDSDSGKHRNLLLLALIAIIIAEIAALTVSKRE